MTYHSEVSVHPFFVLHPIYKNTLLTPQRLYMSVANRMDKLNDACEQQQIKSLSFYQEKWLPISKTQIWVQNASALDTVFITARILSPSRSSASKLEHLSVSLVWAVMKKGTIHDQNPSHLRQCISSASTVCLTVSLLDSCSAWICYQIGFDNDCYLIPCNTHMQLFPHRRTV